MEREKDESALNVDLLLAYLKRNLPEEYIPRIDGELDWKLFGPTISKYFGPDSVLPPEYTDDILLWVNHRVVIRELLRFVDRKLFHIEPMLNNTRLTDNVQRRISTSMLNKIPNLDKNYQTEIFDYININYTIRKPWFENYYCIRILGLPFSLDNGTPCPF